MNELDKWKQIDSKDHARMQSWLLEAKRKWGTDFGNRLPARLVFRAGLADQWRACYENAAWLSRMLGNDHIHFCLTDGGARNAWAFREDPPESEHVIVSTITCFKRMQSLAQLVLHTALRIRPHSTQETTLFRLFKVQAFEPLVAAGICQAVMSSSFLFLLFHEAAHILRGHRYASARPLDGSHSTEDAFAGATGVATSPNLTSVNLRNPNVVSQAKEFDADIHAYRWVNVYFDHVNPRALGALGQTSEQVFHLLLTDPEGRRFVSLLGAFCFHLAISDNATTVIPLDAGTHPSLQERMQLTYLGDHALALQKEAARPWLSECVRFVSAMLVFDQQEGLALVPGASDEIGRVSGESNIAKLKSASRWLGISLDDHEMHELHARRMTLISAMQRIAPQMERHCIRSALPTVQWWVT